MTKKTAKADRLFIIYIPVRHTQDDTIIQLFKTCVCIDSSMDIRLEEPIITQSKQSCTCLSYESKASCRLILQAIIDAQLSRYMCTTLDKLLLDVTNVYDSSGHLLNIAMSTTDHVPGIAAIHKQLYNTKLP